jgi:Ca-activated chloride channel family protein
METFLDFHFLRPWFLLLIPILALLVFWLSQQAKQQTGFEQWINPELLSHISSAKQQNHMDLSHRLRHLLPYGLIGLAWLIISLALAGPTWKQLPQPLHQSEQAMIVVLDLSPSMLAEDIKPSRVVRARLKIQDLLTQRKDGLTALVVYAGEAHTVTPLTDDNSTIINLLATLSPGLLPIPGSNIEMAMTTATQLISDSGLTEGSIVLLTDGIDSSALSTIKNTVNGKADVYIVGIGTEKGAPIPASSSSASSTNGQQNGFLRDENNQIVTAKRDEKVLKKFAQNVSGYYLPLQANNSDIEFILTRIDSASKVNQQDTRKLERNMDQWDELGPLLVLLFLPLFALAFRRGWLLAMIIGITPMMMPEPAYALSWDDLWLNKNQQAQKAFEQKDYEQAEKKFSQHQWQGSAAYKNKDYKAAIEAFNQGDSTIDHYNKGNALSYLGEYDKAIAAYNKALEKDPKFADAKKNKKIIEELKKQQEQNQSSQNGDQKNNDENQQDQQNDQDNNESSGSDSKESNQQESEQQNPQEQKPEDGNQDSHSENEKSDDNNEQDKAQQSAKKDTNDDKSDQTDTEESLDQQDPLSGLSKEERQELEQWLRKVPDDPSGLLRRKFEYEFQKRRQLYQSGQWTLPDNNAHQRY